MDLQTDKISFREMRDKMVDFIIIGKPALLILHMQNFMVGKNIKTNPDAARVVKESGIIPRQQALLKAFREKKLPVIYGIMNTAEGLNNPRLSYGFLQKSLSSVHFTPEDERIIPELTPLKGEIILTHWGAGPFNNSGLDLVLKSFGVETLIVAGFASHGVVYSTVVEAADYFYPTIVPSDASASISEKSHNAVMEFMAPAMALVTPTEDVIAHL